MKMLSENDGLEAWRLIRLNLCNKDDLHIEAEYKVKSKLPKMTTKEMGNLAELLTRWEGEIKRFAAIDTGYDLSSLQKKNAVYEFLPDEMQKVIDVEVSKPNSSIKLWPQWVEFIKDWSRSYQFQQHQKAFKPTPLTANLIDDVAPAPPEPESLKYSTEQWIAWLQGDEGRYHVSRGLPLPDKGKDALYAVVTKGKGKGKGWQSHAQGGKAWQNEGWQSKGKGKSKGDHYGGKSDDGNSPKGKGKSPNWDLEGKFIGKCNICNKPGHMARDCQEAGLHQVANYWIGNESDWSANSPEQWSPGSGTSDITLCITQEATVNYRLDKNCKAEARTKVCADNNKYQIPNLRL